jgi:hypothetical protein
MTVDDADTLRDKVYNIIAEKIGSGGIAIATV